MAKKRYKHQWDRYSDPESDATDKERLDFARYNTVLQVCYRYAGDPPISEAAKSAGISQALFRKIYFQGLPKYKDFPNKGLNVKEVMRSVNVAARSKVDAAESDVTPDDIDGSSILTSLSKANRKALNDAIKSRVEEGKALRVARANSVQLIQMTHHLLKSVGPLAQSINEAVQSGTLDVGMQLKVLKGVSDFSKTAVDFQSVVSKMESNTLGTLQDTLKGLIAGSDGIDEEEAMLIIENAKEALDRAREDEVLLAASQEVIEELDESEDAIVNPKPADEAAEGVQAKPSQAIDIEAD